MLILESTTTYGVNAEPMYGDITAELLAISEDFHELDLKLARAEFQAYVTEDTALKEEAEQGFWARIVKFFQDLWAKITGWFKGDVKKKESEAAYDEAADYYTQALSAVKPESKEYALIQEKIKQLPASTKGK